MTGGVDDFCLLWIVQMVVQLVVTHRGVSAVDLDNVLVSGHLDLPVDIISAIVILGNQMGHGIAFTGLDCNRKTNKSITTTMKTGSSSTKAAATNISTMLVLKVAE